MFNIVMSVLTVIEGLFPSTSEGRVEDAEKLCLSNSAFAISHNATSYQVSFKIYKSYGRI